MVLFGIIPDITSAASAASMVLSLVIAMEAYRAYNYTERSYLLAFVAGFILLALSYALLIPISFGVRWTTVGYQSYDILDYPPRVVMQSIGFILVALAYSQSRRAKYLLYVLVALLVGLIIIVILPGILIPYSVNAILFLINTLLIAYALQRMLKITKAADLVVAGFAFMAISQYTAFVDALERGELTTFLTQLLRLVSLSILFAAFLRIRPAHSIKRSDLAHEQEI